MTYFDEPSEPTVQPSVDLTFEAPLNKYYNSNSGKNHVKFLYNPTQFEKRGGDGEEFTIEGFNSGKVLFSKGVANPAEWEDPGVYNGEIKTNFLSQATQSRSVTYPDKSGTIALIEDINNGLKYFRQTNPPTSPTESSFWDEVGLNSFVNEWVYINSRWVSRYGLVVTNPNAQNVSNNANIDTGSVHYGHDILVSHVQVRYRLYGLHDITNHYTFTPLVYSGLGNATNITTQIDTFNTIGQEGTTGQNGMGTEFKVIRNINTIFSKAVSNPHVFRMRINKVGNPTTNIGSTTSMNLDGFLVAYKLVREV